MARAISGSASVQLQITDNDIGDIITSKAGFSLNYALSLIAGLGTVNPLEIDEIFADQRALAGGANEELDLAGVLIGSHGYTVTFSKVKGILVALPNLDPQASGLIVGGAAAGAFSTFLGGATHTVLVKKGGHFSSFSGLDVAAYAVGANDKLKIANADGAVVATYQIVIVGNKP